MTRIGIIFNFKFDFLKSKPPIFVLTYQMLTQLDFFIVFLYHYTSQTNVDNMLQSLGTYVLLPWNL